MNKELIDLITSTSEKLDSVEESLKKSSEIIEKIPDLTEEISTLVSRHKKAEELLQKQCRELLQKTVAVCTLIPDLGFSMFIGKVDFSITPDSIIIERASGIRVTTSYTVEEFLSQTHPYLIVKVCTVMILKVISKLNSIAQFDDLAEELKVVICAYEELSGVIKTKT